MLIKKLSIAILVVLLLIVCAIASPWTLIQFDPLSLLGIDRPQEFTTLSVSSLAGELEVYIDGVEKGSVGPEGSPFLIEDVALGNREVLLKRVSESESAYIEYRRIIFFEPDIDTVLVYELGPTTEYSEGYLIYAVPNFQQNSTRLSVLTQPESSTIQVAGGNSFSSPVTNVPIDLANQLNLTISAPGYEELNLSLLPAESEQRQLLSGFDIIVEANLFLLPIQVNTSNAN